MKAAFIGLGLIGGSIAYAMRHEYPDSVIVALNRSSAPLEKAVAEGVADIALHDVTDDFSDCDFIFLCAPVHTNITFLEKLKPYIGGKTVLTDVGSVKGEIHKAVSEILPDAHFIGGHPMAGREKSGFENASAGLINNAYYFLTPSENASTDDIRRLETLVLRIGCIPVTVDPDTHDYIVAAISHVPHMAAFSLVHLIKDSDTPEQYMKYTAAGGFKDITRVASSEPTMWEQIALSNKDNIIKLMDSYISELTSIRNLIEQNDGPALHKIFEEARDYRNSIK